MKLGFAILDSNSTVNNLKYLNQLHLASGDTAELYIQIVDLESQRGSNVYSRFVPSAAATLTINFFNHNTALNMTKFAIMPFQADDRSIWKVTLSSTDTQSLNSVTIKGQLIDGATVKTITANNVIIVDPASPFQC